MAEGNISKNSNTRNGCLHHWHLSLVGISSVPHQSQDAALCSSIRNSDRKKFSEVTWWMTPSINTPFYLVQQGFCWRGVEVGYSICGALATWRSAVTIRLRIGGALLSIKFRRWWRRSKMIMKYYYKR